MESNDDIVWLEKSIADEYFNYYEYSDFRNIQPIGKGRYGKVFRVNPLFPYVNTLDQNINYVLYIAEFKSRRY